MRNQTQYSEKEPHGTERQRDEANLCWDTNERISGIPHPSKVSDISDRAYLNRVLVTSSQVERNTSGRVEPNDGVLIWASSEGKQLALPSNRHLADFRFTNPLSFYIDSISARDARHVLPAIFDSERAYSQLDHWWLATHDKKAHQHVRQNIEGICFAEFPFLRDILESVG
jgi:hypothetical protein